MSDLVSSIESAARLATQGEWEAHGYGAEVFVENETSVTTVANCNIEHSRLTGGTAEQHANATHIALACPENVLKLCARVRELEEALGEACDIADATLMPNERVSREWYEKFAGNAGAVLRIAALRSLLARKERGE